MEKVYNLNSAQPSSLIAKQKPRALTYYLGAGLHHKLVGKFVTRASFYTSNLKGVKKKEYTNMADKIEIRKKGKSTDPNRIVTGGSGKFEHGPIANYTETESNPALIKDMVKLSNEVLASAKTVFPIDPFPDSVVLDRTTLNITKRTFFFSNDTLSIRIEDILNAKVNVGPFLGSLTIASRILSSEDHFTINNLWRKDAIHLKHMIQGYIIALHNEIEISHLNREELIETISELGHDLNA